MTKAKTKSATSPSELFFSQAQNREVDHELVGVGAVKVRDLSQSEIEKIREKVKSVEDKEKRNTAFILTLVANSVFVDGKRLFSDDDVSRFDAVGVSTMNPLIEKVMRTNGFFQGS